MKHYSIIIKILKQLMIFVKLGQYLLKSKIMYVTIEYLHYFPSFYLKNRMGRIVCSIIIES